MILKYAIIFTQCVFLFGQTPIIKTKLSGMSVQDASSWYFTRFTTRTQGQYVILSADPGAAPDIDIVRTSLTGTSVQDFDFAGDTLIGFATSGPDANGYVYLHALLKNGGSAEIFRTANSGTGVQDFLAPAGSWISAFTTSTDGEYVYLSAVASLIGIEEKKIDDSESVQTDLVFALNNAVPNPCVNVAQIGYSIAQPCAVDLKIYEVTGRLVRTLVNKELSMPDIYRIYWFGDDDRGRTLSAGIYFVRLDAGDFQAIKKIVLLG